MWETLSRGAAASLPRGDPQKKFSLSPRTHGRIRNRNISTATMKLRSDGTANENSVNIGNNNRTIINTTVSPRSPARSLGSGTLTWNKTSVKNFLPSPKDSDNNNMPPPPKHSHSMNDANLDEKDHHRELVYKRAYSSFLRVADLDIDETLSMKSESLDSDDTRSYPNFNHIAVDPPPGIETDPKERWVVLDDGKGKHAPIAPLAVRALAKSGHEICFRKEMWVPDGKTTKILKNQPAWNDIVWNKDGPVTIPPGLNEDEVLVWSGTFVGGHYGSELPAVRSVAVIDMNPKELLDLLLDSNRVKEYNKLCLGRDDLLVFEEEAGSGPFGGITTKIVKTQTKPPVIRKTLQFTSLMHACELSHGYELVTRAVTLPEEKEDLANALKSEILLAATLIKPIEGDDNRCLFITVNHLRTPMIPMMIAKRIGLQAATGFISDLRGCCKK